MELTDILIRDANADDWENAMELAWKTFLKFEGEVYGELGKKNFLDFISGEQLYKLFLSGNYRMVVAICDGKIVGMGTLRSGNHISLLFVDEKYHWRGIGRKILSKLQEGLDNGRSLRLTVNSSPYGEGFYRKLGFIPFSDWTEADGITFLPMECFSQIK